jgi:Kef-type K+ transport system membrane component KefB
MHACVARARLIGFDGKASLGMDVLTSAQISTTLATASIGLQYAVFKEGVLASLVVLSIVSIVVAPFLAEWALGVKLRNLANLNASGVEKTWKKPHRYVCICDERARRNNHFCASMQRVLVVSHIYIRSAPR